MDRLHKYLVSLVKGRFYGSIKINFEDGTTRYEHSYGHSHHDHLICTSCGKFIEVFLNVWRVKFWRTYLEMLIHSSGSRSG